ncbi:MAG: hypothetical protein IT379_42230 [Deltaproteobacteria bacterium]|nr:hypothetical protein [Deltaproteobacteria bacterium]
MLVCSIDGAATVRAEDAVLEDVDPTDVSPPRRTTFAEARIDAAHVDDAGTRERLVRAVRLAVEADAETSPSDARAKRRHAALDVVTELETVLRRRLADQTSRSEIRAAWLGMLGDETRDDVAGTRRKHGRPALRAYLESGRAPSLAVMGGWLRPVWRVPPPELADFIQLSLGVPRGLEEDVFLAGELRNVLAHAADYEVDATRRLGPVEGLVRRVQVPLSAGRGGVSTGPAGVELEVLPESISWLEWLAPSVLARRSTTERPESVSRVGR